MQKAGLKQRLYGGFFFCVDNLCGLIADGLDLLNDAISWRLRCRRHKTS